MNDIELQLLLDVKGFANGIKTAMQMLQNFSKQASGLLNIKAVNFDTKSIDDFASKNNAFQTSVKQSAAATGSLTAATSKATAQQVVLKDKLAATGLTLQGISMLWLALKSTVGSWIQSADSAEIANAKLANGMKNVGEGIASVNALSSQASQLKAITPFSGSEIKNAQAMLTTFMKSSEEIKILTPRILDLAAAYMKSGDSSMDVQQVAVMLGKVNEETIGALRRVGVAFSNEQAEKLKSLHGTEQAIFLSQILDQNFKGMAQTVGQTSAGQMKIFQNQLGALKASMGAIIIEGLRPVISFLKDLAAVLSAQPAYVKGSILAVTALVVAFKFLGSSISPTAKAFAIISALLIALPPGLRIVAGGILIVASAIFVLNGGLATANTLLGGLPVFLGLLASGVVALFTGISSASENTEEKIQSLDKSISDSTQRLNDLKSANSNLTKIYDYLNGNIVHTDESTAAYNQSLEAVKNAYPALHAHISLYNSDLDENNKLIQEQINKNNESISVHLNAIVAENIQKIQAESESRKKQNEELEKEIELRNKLEYNINRGGEVQGYGKETMFVPYSESEMKTQQDALAESKRKIDILNASWADYIEKIYNSISATRSLGLSDDETKKVMQQQLDAYISLMQNQGVGAQNAFMGALAKLGVTGYDSFEKVNAGITDVINQLFNARKEAQALNSAITMTTWQENMQKEIKAVQDNITNPKDKSLTDAAEKQIKDIVEKNKDWKKLQSDIDEIINPKEPSRSTSRRSAPTSAIKDEEDEVRELISAWQQAIKFYYASAEVKESLSAAGISSAKNEIQVQSELDDILKNRTNLTVEQISELSDFRDEIAKVNNELNFTPRTKDTFIQDYMEGARQIWEEQQSRSKSTEPWESRSVKELEKAIKLYNDWLGLTGDLSQQDIDYLELQINNQIKVTSNFELQIQLQSKIVALEKQRNEIIEKRIEAEDLLTQISHRANQNSGLFSTLFGDASEGFNKKYNDILSSHQKTQDEISKNLSEGVITDNEAQLAQMENDIDARKSIQKIVYQQIRDGFSAAVSGVQEIASILGIGANTFVGKLISGLQFAVSLATSISSTISSILSIVASVGKLAASPAIGFATGGSVPGIGSSDSVPAMLTPGEFIINKSSVNNLVRRFGSAFLPWLNGGSMLSHFANQYAGGGIVTSPAFNIQSSREPYILTTSIKGQDLNVVLTRAKNYQQSRLL